MGWRYNGVTYKTREDMCLARRDHYFRLLVEGVSYSQAAKIVGVSKRTGKVWRNGRTRSNGRNEKAVLDTYRETMNELAPVSKCFLSLDDRLLIADLLATGHSISAIATIIGRNRSTIWREIQRNTCPTTRTYMPYHANKQAYQRRRRPKKRKLATNTCLHHYVQTMLNQHWSPEQISKRIKIDFPDNTDMRISHETIYQAIYIQAKGHLRRDLAHQLRTGRTRRKPHKQTHMRKTRFRDPMIMISEREPTIEDRAIPGHWEGDLIIGSRGQSAIGTLVERTTRTTILLHLPNGHDSHHVQQAIIKKMKNLPHTLRKSLTWDQGSELAQHTKIATNLDINVYFCDPHSPWQRGTNENTNGLLRQYFPKHTDLSIYPEEYLDAVAQELNNRPRKTLNWQKPNELFHTLLTT